MDQRTIIFFPACLKITGKIYLDQTGQFLVPSTNGNKYVLLLYDYDCNYMILLTIPSRTKIQLKRIYEKYVQLLKSKGFAQKLHSLDNETSKLMTEYMDAESITYQLTPTGSH